MDTPCSSVLVSLYVSNSELAYFFSEEEISQFVEKRIKRSNLIFMSEFSRDLTLYHVLAIIY